MSIRLIPALLLTAVVGFVLGSIPGLNEHLHWNLWYVVPISGVIFGAMAGAIQIGVCYGLNAKAMGSNLVFLLAASVVGYVAIDYGIYHAQTVPVQDIEGIPDGEYSLSEMVTFGEYMKWRLGSSSVSTKHGDDAFEMGGTATTITFIVDLLGVLLASLGVLVIFHETHPFCDRCARYKRREQKFEIPFADGGSEADEVRTAIVGRIEEGDFGGLIDYLRDAAASRDVKKPKLRISVDQRVCRRCGETTLLGKEEVLSGDGWQETFKFDFAYDPTEQPTADV